MRLAIHARCQEAFLEALLGAPGVTQAGAAAKLGVDASLFSRWRTGERALPLDAALALTEWAGPAALQAAAGPFGLRVEVRGPADRVGAEGTTEEVLGGLVGELGRQLASLAGTLSRVRRIRGADRSRLVAELIRLETAVRAARVALEEPPR